MRKFNIFTTLIILLAMTSALMLPPAAALDDPAVRADAALLADASTGQILYEKDKDKKVPAGGTAMVMTLLLAAEAVEDGQVRPDDIVTVSQTALKAVDKNDRRLGLADGETMRLEDLMYGAYLVSAGDACSVIAEYVSGSAAAFTKEMNDRAARLGCTGTHFVSPGASADAGQYTTAWDQYLIFREAVRHPLFLDIAGTLTHKTAAGGSVPARTVENANLMLHGNSQYFDSAVLAGKPDDFNKSYSLISYAKDKDMTLISVLLGTEAAEAGSTAVYPGYTETKRLLHWGLSGFTRQTLADVGNVVATEKVNLAYGTDRVEISPLGTVTALLPVGFPPDNSRREILLYNAAEGKQLTAPVRRGDILGEMTVYMGGDAVGSVQLMAATDVALDKGAYIKLQLLKTLSSGWIQLGIGLLILLLAGYIVLVVRDSKKRRAEKRRIEEIRRQLIAERHKMIDEEEREHITV